ncbi:hypothetical protein NXX48_24355 [Bacteroides faecis]|nr:hypothetical protein [Bacteroides faecis]
MAAGLRANSAKLIWAKKLTDMGISSFDMTTGIAVTNDYCRSLMNVRRILYTCMPRMAKKQEQ